MPQPQQQQYESNLTPKSTGQDNSCGAIWERTNARKTKYLSLKVEIEGIEYHFKAFLNAKKNFKDHEDKKPSYILYESTNVPQYDSK